MGRGAKPKFWLNISIFQASLTVGKRWNEDLFRYDLKNLFVRYFLKEQGAIYLVESPEAPPLSSHILRAPEDF